MDMTSIKLKFIKYKNLIGIEKIVGIQSEIDKVEINPGALMEKFQHIIANGNSKVPDAMLKAYMGQVAWRMEQKPTIYAEARAFEDFILNAGTLLNPSPTAPPDPICPLNVYFDFVQNGTCGYTDEGFGPYSFVMAYDEVIYICNTPNQVYEAFIKFGGDIDQLFHHIKVYLWALRKKCNNASTEFAIGKWLNELQVTRDQKII